MEHPPNVLHPGTVLAAAGAAFVGLLAMTRTYFWPISASVALAALLTLSVLALTRVLDTPEWMAWTGIGIGAVWTIAPHLWRPMVAWLLPVLPIIGGAALVAIGVSMLVPSMLPRSNDASHGTE